MTTDEVMDALGRYAKDSKESDRETAAKLGIRRSLLGDWLRGKTQPAKSTLAQLAGFLKRVGYL
ncbi:MAG: helix-turn-helix transcriptional regulator [Verrucomicrobia bacterium]|nr:helix-turn-helix transcriptional regulator [Verrucomicrobiota bacterium]